MTGKGSKPRPFSVSQEIYDLRYTMAFGTDEQKEDAAARLKFLEWEESKNNNPHLWGDDDDQKALRNS